MEKINQEIKINLGQYKDIEDLFYDDEMFMNDLYLNFSTFDGCWYIYNGNQDLWYSLENRFDYGIDWSYLIKNKEEITFYLIEDKEILGYLREEFL